MIGSTHRERFLLSLASGLALYACFYPLNFGELAWVAFVPLMLAVFRAGSGRQVLLYSLTASLAFYLPVMQWMRVAHPMMYLTWIGLSLACSLFFTLGVFLIRRFVSRGCSLWLTLPAVWTLLEYIRAHFPVAFPFLEPLGVRHYAGFGWYQVGYSQRDNLWFMQLASLTGVYGISFLILMVNGLVADRLLMPKDAPARRWYRRLAVTAVMVLLTHAEGYRILNRETPTTHSINLALVQTNLPQDLKNDRAPAMLDQFRELGQQAARQHPDLIIWPETACPFEWWDAEIEEERDNLPAEVLERQTSHRKTFRDVFHCATLTGLNAITTDAAGEKWKYNSALLLDAEGNYGGRYDKMHLVPFGEYVPLRKIAPWLKAFTPYDHDYSCKPGERKTIFQLKVKDCTVRFGSLICYEDSDATLTREIVDAARKQTPLDFLVNISNDGWFDGTAEHDEHLSICRFRAVETRRPIVRAVNMGISAVIDSKGRVIALPGKDYASSKKMEGVLFHMLELPDTPLETTYTWFGDWLVALSLIIVCFRFGQTWKAA